ncbi:MAG: lysophospholipid acyltransferase family protein [Paracoccaceae bacterium]
MNNDSESTRGGTRAGPAAVRSGSVGDWAENFGKRLLVKATSPLPMNVRGAFAGRLMQLIVPLSPNLRRRIDNNLDLVFPDLGPAERQALRRRILLNLGRSLMEMQCGAEIVAQKSDFHVSGPGFEALRRARAEGRGAIIMAAHFGHWEAGRITLMDAGMECGALYRPSNNPLFDSDYFDAIRQRGEPVFPRGAQGMRAMIRHLRKGGFVGVMHDQSIKRAPLFRFMGHPAHTATTIAELALKFDLLVVPNFNIRRENSPEVDVVFESPAAHTTPAEMTQELNDRLEARVRANPEQFYWLHQRWKLHKDLVDEGASPI